MCLNNSKLILKMEGHKEPLSDPTLYPISWIIIDSLIKYQKLKVAPQAYMCPHIPFRFMYIPAGIWSALLTSVLLHWVVLFTSAPCHLIERQQCSYLFY